MEERKPECFVIMPYGKNQRERKHSDNVYRTIIHPAVDSAFGKYDLESRLDKQFVRGTLTAALREKLKSADVVIADLSGNNPNVSFELGFRYAQDKPFVCISDDPSSAGFWANKFKIIKYEMSNKPKSINLIGDEIQKAYKGIEAQLDSEYELNGLINSIRVTERFVNPLQDRMASWRIERARDQVESIIDKEWDLDAKMPPAYIAFIFEGIMEKLRYGDEYYTVTNMDFWSEKAVGASGFLDANKKAVVERGVVIKRVFLIDKRKWNSKSSRRSLKEKLEKHLKAYFDIERSRPGGMFVKCLVLEHYNKELDERYHHFGLVRHIENNIDKGRILIIPRYQRLGKMISGLKLTFSGKSTKRNMETQDYLAVFNEAFDNKKAKELHEFLRRA